MGRQVLYVDMAGGKLAGIIQHCQGVKVERIVRLDYLVIAEDKCTQEIAQ